MFLMICSKINIFQVLSFSISQEILNIRKTFTDSVNSDHFSDYLISQKKLVILVKIGFVKIW